MKNLIRKIITPVLKPLEESNDDYEYLPAHRTFLKFLGVLFIGIAGVTLYFVLQISQWAGLLPVLLFSGIGVISLMVAAVGTDKAIAKIWRNRN